MVESQLMMIASAINFELPVQVMFYRTIHSVMPQAVCTAGHQQWECPCTAGLSVQLGSWNSPARLQ